MKRSVLGRKAGTAPLGHKTGASSLSRKTPLTTQQKTLTRSASLKNTAPLKRTASLKSSATLKSTTSLKSSARLKSTATLKSTASLQRATPLTNKKALAPGAGPQTQARQKRAPQALPDSPKSDKLAPKKTRRSRAPERSPGFLAFVRLHPCDACETTSRVEAHHWGRHGLASKCSDYEAVPLCHEHHVEGWHRHGTLPGREREAWLERWRERSLELRAAYEAQASSLSALTTGLTV